MCKHHLTFSWFISRSQVIRVLYQYFRSHFIQNISPCAADAEGRVMEGAGCGAGPWQSRWWPCHPSPEARARWRPLIGPDRSRDPCAGLWLARPLRPGRDGDWPERYILYLRDIVSANIQIMPASLSHPYPGSGSRHNWLKQNNTSSTKFSNICVQILTKFTTISRLIMPGSGVRIKYNI